MSKNNSAQLSFFNSLDLLVIAGGVIHCFFLQYYESTITPANDVTSIKQSSVFTGHLSCSCQKTSSELNLF